MDTQTDTLVKPDMEGGVTRTDGTHMTFDGVVRRFGYIIADLTPSLRTVLKKHDFKNDQNPHIFFRYRDGERLLIQVPESETWVQAGFSYDTFGTKEGEHYFALSFHGYEWVINLGGPAIKGYEKWLVDNGNISPLVERVGMKVVQRDGVHGFAHYMDGEGDFNVGVEFDAVQLQRSKGAG
jgi:hypothetical protein